MNKQIENMELEDMRESWLENHNATEKDVMVDEDGEYVDVVVTMSVYLPKEISIKK